MGSPTLNGMACLAIAMGIGRFAFTPILPMMSLPVAEGGWLASANYAGYLAGALTAMVLRWSPRDAIRAGLAIVAAATLAMAWTASFTARGALRFAAGVASAWVLVNVSALGSPRPELVFSGVGSGIALAGLVCVAVGLAGGGAEAAWTALGVIAIAGLVPTWKLGAARATAAGNASAQDGQVNPVLVFCYGAFGFGYIVPATFLPAMAKVHLPDPAAFGWVWPVFGAAAALSTLVAAPARRRWGDRDVWAASHWLMAAGVAIPIVPGVPAVAALILSACLVGGTFMVATLAGMQEARRIAGAGARRLMAAMTAAFAVGQIAGPMLVSLADNVTLSLAAAVLLLAATAITLRRTR
jgi:hypothetical protein